MHNTILISTAIAASLPLIPVGHYLAFGWAARKNQIVSRLTAESIGYYKTTFCPESTFASNADFATEYNYRYGRRLFFFPVLLFAAAVIFLCYRSLEWLLVHDWAGAGQDNSKIAIFSIAGAYLWVTYDLILRARQNDVVTSDINRATLRLLLSLPFGFSIAAFAGTIPNSTITLGADALAFFVGAFPTDAVLKFMRRTAGGALKLDADPTGENARELMKIDGISVPIAERLIDEGVTTNAQLAYCDPITLTIKSGMDFAFILGCCGEALVRIYFTDEQMQIVRKFGLRTCIEVKDINDVLLEYDGIVDAAAAANTAAAPRNSAQAAADGQLRSLVAELNIEINAVRFILDQIAGDPYTKFVWNIWE